ncbi:MAG: hypothetical protein PUG15_08850, partial [Bacteroidales bacterium]|nr:hypothetical protein [Bacteroidales bacterium]
MVKIYSVSFIKQKLRWIILLLLLSISAFGAERIDLLSGSSNDAGGCGGDWYKIGDSNNSICTDAGRLRVNDCGGTGRKEFQLPGGKNWTGANGYQQTYPDWYVVIEARTSVENTKIGFWGGSSETRNYDQYNSGVVPTDDYGYVVLGPLSNIGGKNEAKFQLFSKNVDICIKSVYLTDVPPTMVGKPKNVTANAVAYNQINVTWTALDNAASYDVYRAQSNDCASATYSKVTSVTAASFNDTGRTPNTKYCYYIVAVASDGTESSPSEKVTATTPLKPSTVSLTATPVDHKAINLNWTDTEGTAGTVYEIYRGKSATGPFEKIATQTGNTAYTDEGNLSPETTYYYRIQISDGGQSLPSAVVNATTTELISSVTIKVNPNPTVTISGTLTGCPNSTVSLTAEGLGGTPNYTYTWTGATATTGNGANAVLPSTCTNASVSVTVTDAKECKGTDTKTITAAITVAPSIIANVSGGDLGCNPATIPTLTSADFTVTDACAATPLATVTSDAVQTNGCQKSQTWHANYTNACGQSAVERTVTYTWTETTAPSITAKVSDDDLGCNPGAIPTLTSADFTVTDACAANPSATVTTDGIQTNGCQKSQTWHANYTNACGQAAVEQTVTYTWTETTAPSITANVSGDDLGCNPATIPTLTSADFTVTDACAANPLATVTSDAIQTNGCQKSQTWRANYTNACGQAAVEQTVTYTWKEDAENPVIGDIQTSVELTSANCTFTVPDFESTVMSATTDNCGGLTYEQDFAAGSAATNGQTVTVTVTDGCDNHTSKEITLVVPAPPTIVSSNVACDADLLTYHADVTVTYGTATATVTTTSGTLTQDGTNPNLYHITQITKGTDITVKVTDA